MCVDLIMYVDGWMEALAENVHRQEEHIPQHCYISHHHAYISSSE